MELSKTLDSIPRGLLIAKLNAYGLSFDTVIFLSSFVKDRKQNVRINNILSAFQNILSDIPQGSKLGPIPFNVFPDDLFLCIKKSGLYNFADDITITTTCNNLTKLLKNLEHDTESAVNWFKQNKIIVNTGKFQVIIVKS